MTGCSYYCSMRAGLLASLFFAAGADLDRRLPMTVLRAGCGLRDSGAALYRDQYLALGCRGRGMDVDSPAYLAWARFSFSESGRFHEWPRFLKDLGTNNLMVYQPVQAH